MGTFGRWCEIVAALAGIAAPLALVGAPEGSRRSRTLLAVATTASLAAVLALGLAFLRSDFTLVYVTDQSRRGASAAIRFAGIWAGMEGSLLLWGATAAVVGLVASLTSASALGRDLAERVAAVSGAIVAAILALVLGWADPFARLEIPAISGRGLTPILEHPAMAYHPPLLYLGVVGFLAGYAATVAAASLGRLDGAWFRYVRRALLIAWTLTTLGLTTGANWAYVELGWGGYWAWDPVENSALVPWLAATAFLHAGRTVAAERPALSAALAALPFLLVAAGAAATRSGSLNSVHGFAEAVVIGRGLAVLAAAVTIVLLVAYMTGVRTDRTAIPAGVGDAGVDSHVASSSTGSLDGRTGRPLPLRLRLAGAVVTFAAAVIVATGTIWPLFFNDGRVVGGRFFTSLLGPVAFVAVAVAAWAPLAGRGARSDGRAGFLRIVAAVVGAGAALMGAWVAGWQLTTSGTLLASATGAAVLGVLASVGGVGRRAVVAHLGMAVLLIGAAGSTAVSEIGSRGIETGERFSLAGYEFENRGVRTEVGPVSNSTRVVADIALLRGDREITVLTPQLVSYGDRRQVLAETALRSRPLDDVQVVLERATDDGLVVVTARVTPLVQLVWWGSLLTALGGLIVLRRPKSAAVRDSRRGTAVALPLQEAVDSR